MKKNLQSLLLIMTLAGLAPCEVLFAGSNGNEVVGGGGEQREREDAWACGYEAPALSWHEFLNGLEDADRLQRQPLPEFELAGQEAAEAVPESAWKAAWEPKSQLLEAEFLSGCAGAGGSESGDLSQTGSCNASSSASRIVSRDALPGGSARDLTAPCSLLSDHRHQPPQPSSFLASLLASLETSLGASQALDLRNQPITTPHDLEYLVAWLRRYPQLRQLNLQNTGLNDESMKVLVKTLKLLRGLTHLNVSDCPVGAEGILALAQNFIFLPHLRDLDLSGIAMSDDTLRGLTRRLRYLSKPTRLILRGGTLNSTASESAGAAKIHFPGKSGV